MTDVDSSADAVATTTGPLSQTDGLQNSNVTNSVPIDPSLTKRPRDAHAIHTILHSVGVNAYQERVPLQLMDFAYRYTTGILQDAVHMTNEAYGATGAGIGATGTGNRNNSEANSLTVTALRHAIFSKTHYQLNSSLPKEFYLDMAEQKNRVTLPSMPKTPGISLPPEQYMLTEKDWEMGEEFDLMETEEIDGGEQGQDRSLHGDGDDEAEGGTMEDLFGPDGGTNNQDDGMEE